MRQPEDAILAPLEIAAGPTVLIVMNEEAEPVHAFDFLVPDEISDAKLESTLSSGPVAEDAPNWFWTADFLGNADPDQRQGRALVGVGPGRYVVGDPYRPVTEFAQVNAPAPAPAATNLPAPDPSIEVFEMGFSLPEQVAGGPQLWRFTNTGGMLHEMDIIRCPPAPAHGRCSRWCLQSCKPSSEVIRHQPAPPSMPSVRSGLAGPWI